MCPHVKCPYTKSFLSVPEQVLRLEEQGMIIKNEDEKILVENFLSNNNYYRFSGLHLVFKTEKINPFALEQILKV